MRKIAQIAVTFLSTIDSEEIGLENFEEKVEELIKLDITTINNVANYLYANDVEIEIE